MAALSPTMPITRVTTGPAARREQSGSDIPIASAGAIVRGIHPKRYRAAASKHLRGLTEPACSIASQLTDADTRPASAAALHWLCQREEPGDGERRFSAEC